VNQLFEALGSAGDGAFVIDEDLRIVYWNKSAGVLLGFDNKDVIGQFCYQFLHGCDEGGHLICRARCRVAKLTLKSKPVHNYDIRVTTKQGDKRWLSMSVFAYKVSETGSEKVIVHLFHNLDHKKVDEKLLAYLVEVIRRYQDIPSEGGVEMESHLKGLTPRERKILTLLARGHSTSEIGEMLSISQNTLRNHVQHILQKFQVHTRLEAVTRAIENDLIGKMDANDALALEK